MALAAGLHGERRLLDVGCGTGKSFLPFLERGWDVTACDVSSGMVQLAAAKAGGRARVEVHDMRSLPVIGSFDLIVCLDDALNYLLEPSELVAALAGMRANLAPGGLLLFDLNSVRTYREAFASLEVMTAESLVIVWRGETDGNFDAGGRASAVTQVLHRSEHGWREASQRHLQRHHPEPKVLDALRAAALDLVETRGMELDGTMPDRFDELACSKAIYLARARDQAQSPGTGTRGT